MMRHGDVNGGYRYKVDVFSFGVMLNHLWTRETPYMNTRLSPFIFMQKVLNGLRPRMDVGTLPPVAKLIKKCWHPDPTMRPSFEEIVATLDSKRMQKAVQLCQAGAMHESSGWNPGSTKNSRPPIAGESKYEESSGMHYNPFYDVDGVDEGHHGMRASSSSEALKGIFSSSEAAASPDDDMMSPFAGLSTDGVSMPLTGGRAGAVDARRSITSRAAHHKSSTPFDSPAPRSRDTASRKTSPDRIEGTTS